MSYGKRSATQTCKQLARDIGGSLAWLFGANFICYGDRETRESYVVPDMTDEELEAILTSSNPLDTIYQWDIVNQCHEGKII